MIDSRVVLIDSSTARSRYGPSPLRHVPATLELFDSGVVLIDSEAGSD